jgi:cell division protein FtsN
MLFGLGLGLIVAVGVYLRAPTSAPRAGEAAAPATVATTPARATSAASASQPAAESRFEFYEILPQLEVAVPESNEPAARAPRPRPAETPGSFLLQAGSFSAAADADRLQASLALLGFESHIQRVTIDSAVFNRVRIGPIADLDTARRAQRRLRDAGIDALMMQVPK